MCPRACAARDDARPPAAADAQEAQDGGQQKKDDTAQATDSAGSLQQESRHDTLPPHPDEQQLQQLGGLDTVDGARYLAGFQWSALTPPQQDAFRQQYAKTSNCGGSGGEAVFDACSYGQADGATCVMMEHTKRLRFPYLCVACSTGLVDAPCAQKYLVEYQKSQPTMYAQLTLNLLDLVNSEDDDILAHVCYECVEKQRQLCEQDSQEGKKKDTSVAIPAPTKKAPPATSEASASS